MKKVILITGASSGMGKESAKVLIQKGHTVYTVARRIEQMQDLKELGGRVIYNGTFEGLKNSEFSITNKYLSDNRAYLRFDRNKFSC